MIKNARPFRPSRSSRRHVAALFLFLLSPAIGQAARERPGARETVIAGDYFGAGAIASPGGRVEGDALIAGGQVDLNQPVNGDALDETESGARREPTLGMD